MQGSILLFKQGLLSCMAGSVVSVSLNPKHEFSKHVLSEVRLIAGCGVEGDAHAGATVKHRYRVRKDARMPNLCQVHLIHAELFDELAAAGIAVGPGEMGENITTRGLDLLGMGVGTLLHVGAEAVIEVTGLRDPCAQMNGFRPGLMKACLARDAAGRLVRKAGIMGVVVSGGLVRPGDAIRMEAAAGGWVEMGPV